MIVEVQYYPKRDGVRWCVHDPDDDAMWRKVTIVSEIAVDGKDVVSLIFAVEWQHVRTGRVCELSRRL